MGEHCTEQGNARRLVCRHGANIRFVHAWGRWILFVGGRWMRDETAELARLAKETVRSIHAEAAAAEIVEERTAVAKWALQSEKARQIDAMLELARSEEAIAVSPHQLDADPWLVTVLNGTIDLRTGALRPHDPADLITRLAPVTFDPTAACPRFLAFLDRCFGGRADLIGFLQRFVGYLLTGLTVEQCLLILFGLGANGKTTLLQVLRALLGDYATTASFATFAERHAGAPSNDLARLAGARLVLASESGEGAWLNEGLVKQLTGGDTIAARFLYGEFFEYTPAFKLVLATNHKPTIRGTDHAIWRRIHLVPCTVTIPEGERDPRLLDKLTAELPGILRWALDGCLAWQRQGLEPPLAVRSATAEYRDEMDVVGAFLDDCCQLTATGRTGSSALYGAYQRWAEQGGERPMPQRRFVQRLVERGLVRVKSMGIQQWCGLGLVEQGGGRERELSGDSYARARAGRELQEETPSSSLPPSELPLLRERGVVV